MNRECRVANEQVLFFLELTDEYVDYSKNKKEYFGKIIERLSEKPQKVTTPSDFLPGIFASLGDSLFSGSLVSRSEHAQTEIINLLLELYPDRLMYSMKVVNIKRKNEKQELQPTKLPKSTNPESGYVLSSWGSYSLMLHYYNRPKDVFSSPNITVGILQAYQTSMDKIQVPISRSSLGVLLH